MFGQFFAKPSRPNEPGPPPGEVAPGPTPPVAGATGAADGSLEAVIGLIEGDLKRLRERLSASGAEIRAAAASNTASVETIRAGSHAMVTETERARADAAAVASAIREFATSSASVAAQARGSTRLVADADAAAAEATRRIDDLRHAIGDIQTVVSLIADVAGQTNLLALNATIEAARAGAAGRGFAVVAQEVKALALETQRATAEISGRIGRLQEAAEQSIGAVGTVIGIIAEIRPAAAGVADAVEGQEAAVREVADTAGQNMRFAESVRERALAIEDATRSAVAVGSAVAASTERMGATVDDLTRQLVTVIRQSPAADRRRHDRWPVEIHGTFGPGRRPVHTIDLSLGGVLLAPEPGIRRGETGRLELQGLGSIEARVVETSPLGLHCAFLEPAAAGLEARIAAVAEAFREPIARAQAGAAAVARAIDGAVAAGRLTLRDLFDVVYEPIPGTDPQQFRTPALDILDQILPPIQEPVLAADERMTFAAAVDLNGYLPVHNRKYSNPQRPGETVWNAANARNRRIFDDRAGLLAARNARPFLVQSYARDLGGGTVVVMKEVDAPIHVGGRHWGGFRTAYRL